MSTLDRAAISARLKQARFASGITQREVAARFGVHENTVQLWENGQKNKKTKQREWSVPWERLDDLADLYDVTTDWIQHGARVSPLEAQADRLADVIEKLNEVLDRLEKRLAV